MSDYEDEFEPEATAQSVDGGALEPLTDEDGTADAELDDDTTLGPSLAGTPGDVGKIAAFHAARRNRMADAAEEQGAYVDEGNYDCSDDDDKLAASTAMAAAAAAEDEYDATLAPHNSSAAFGIAPRSHTAGNATPTGSKPSPTARKHYFHDVEDMTASFDALLAETSALKAEKAALLRDEARVARKTAEAQEEIRRLSARAALAAVPPGGAGGAPGGASTHPARDRGGAAKPAKQQQQRAATAATARARRVAARTLELRLLHEELTRELSRTALAIKHARQDSVGLRRRAKALSGELSELPAGMAMTLVEARVALLALLDEKNALAEKAAARAAVAARSARERARENAALETELGNVAASLRSAREEARSWRSQHGVEAAKLTQLGAQEAALRAELQDARGVKGLLQLEFERFATQSDGEGGHFVLRPEDAGRALAHLVAGQEAAMESEVARFLAAGEHNFDAGLSFDDFYELFVDRVLGSDDRRVGGGGGGSSLGGDGAGGH